MRAFHCSWWCFFIAFFIWFAITPLLGEIQRELGLSQKQVWTAGVGGTILMRLLLGSACDKWGARLLFSVVLCAASIPTACTGMVNDATGLVILRLFIGIAGGSFVMCQYWTSSMFTKEIAGTANALVGGWGNLGGGVTQLVMGSILFPVFKVLCHQDTSRAWRTVSIVPAIIAFTSGLIVYHISDDSPKGNYQEMKNNGTMSELSAHSLFLRGIMNYNTWLLFVQYGCCFGVELTMNSAAATYFQEEFSQSTESAASIASIFGWINIFARGLGGFTSDKMNQRMMMRGRIIAQTIFLAAEGIFVLIFAHTQTLGGSIIVLIFFSIFVQAAEGTSYGIVPYVDSKATGTIAGIVGAGGNVGAVCFGLGFRNLAYRDAFILMGCSVLGSVFLSALFFIDGHSALFCGEEEQQIETLDSTTQNPRTLEQEEEALIFANK